ncbi:protein of unknown function [Pseudodesulfovibrio piezophilus C1TLV30]|uniref:Uncharacterized protein n=1 Tax=Pseudodesulfovibrio piezophilus (strain DSM 21447 / JCM 15486 / C1TLV30) TaxID=1322246 RepID=M1WPI7_PSEP2|nr:protein of unknown function [Pseudodesulfovibrio piezophilus C1TLV30]
MKNAVGQQLVESIMNNPDTMVKNSQTNRYGERVGLIVPGGRATFRGGWTFRRNTEGKEDRE